jgi:predicted glutamine amidotransferase
LKPKNSLINQSFDAQEGVEPLNGDGFGLGWYARKIRKEPAIFKSITPAWNNINLQYNAGVIKSNCIIAHVRAATHGAVSEQNTHPFHYGRYLMMQNGGVEQFDVIKRELLSLLSDKYFNWIQGQTDSEHIFALFMQNVADINKKKPSLLELSTCLKKAFDDIEELKIKHGLADPSLYNTLITDGSKLLATRYSTNPDQENRTLYFTSGKKYVCEGDLCRMVHDEVKVRSILVASERLDDVGEWTAIPQNHCLMVERDISYELKSMD